MLDNYKQLLKEVIAFQSVSTLHGNQEEITKTYEWYRRIFEQNGFKVEVITGYDNPVIIASYEFNAKETCLIYGHYDVQPALMEDGWQSNPFAVAEEKGRLVARGVVDNKGQSLVHIVSIIELIKNKQLKYNVKFIIEGNEETGSPNIANLISEHKDLLDCDFILVSDGELTANLPTIEASLRGALNITLEVQTADKEVHSGMYGGAIPNAAHELAKLIASFYDADNRIRIPGFYEGSPKITQEELNNNSQIPFSLEMIKHNTGAKAYTGEEDLDFYTQVGLRPTIQVTGMSSGYISEGFRNSIPAKAQAKINIRTVGQQDPLKLVDYLADFVKKTAPEYIRADVIMPDRNEAPAGSVEIDINSTYVRKASEILEQVFGNKVIKKYVGGTLPIIGHFQTILQRPIVMVPLANEDCGMHSPNENFEIKILEKSLQFSKLFFSKNE